MRPSLLAVNAGSATLKFRVYADNGADLLVDGLIDRFGDAAGSVLTLSDARGNRLEEKPLQEPGKEASVAAMINTLADHRMRVDTVVHRVVHGGGVYTQPVRLTGDVRERMEEWVPLAPLHQPVSLAVIDAFSALDAALCQIACFDTAFHATQPEVATRFGIARHWHDEGIRRYGFHGLSYASIARRLPALGLDQARVVVCHLGSGASACALASGESVAASTGFSTVEGLMMSTRPGAIDPEVLLYWMEHEGMGVREVRRELYKNSGLLGVSGLSADMRQLLTSTLPAAREAVELFCYRVVREIGALAACMKGIDALIFTAGIGERSPEIRARVLKQLSWLGFELDLSANLAQARRLTAPTSLRHAYIVPTDEEGEMARAAAALLAEPA
ncbi:acetate/propionate family kinase [Paludibacterium sp.]|uniref:acetate/propionate family kinase n=1 Tax=Paludibacterium sp. TaxID=1917523 RepID=UPI0025D51FA0|nr:acetate/propionate family kinase [Paludibacterium sp.]MBV8646050.1 acetate/propionate family kinase [Paludibacterium sp.]